MSALLGWINTFKDLEIFELNELSNGVIFEQILCEIDSTWFKPLKRIDSGNWVIKYNKLQRLYKLSLGYFQEKLKKSTTQLTEPDLTAIAKDANEDEILKFGTIIISLAVQCPNNQIYVERIQTLNSEMQTELMISIESVRPS